MVARRKARRAGADRPNGWSKGFTKTCLETALNEEMTEHLGYEKHGAEPDRESANIAQWVVGRRR